MTGAENAPDDLAHFRDELLKKRRLEILDNRKPWPTRCDTNTRQGDLADQASGNNEVHIHLKLKQTDAKILRRSRRRSAARSRTAPTACAATAASRSRAARLERDSLDARLHHLQGEAEGVTSPTPSLPRRRPACAPPGGLPRSPGPAEPPRRRRDAHGRLRVQQHLPVRDRPRGDPRAVGARRGRRSRAPRCRRTSPTLAVPEGKGVAGERAILEDDAAHRPGVRRQVARRGSRDVRNARHRKMLDVDPRRSGRADAVLRAGAGRPRRPARPPDARRQHRRRRPAGPLDDLARRTPRAARRHRARAATWATAATISRPPSTC